MSCKLKVVFYDVMTKHFFFLFLRCLLRDKEVACKDKDMEIRDLKEKVVRLSCSLRQMEMQKAELIHQVKLQVSMFSIPSDAMPFPFSFLGSKLSIKALRKYPCNKY